MNKKVFYQIIVVCCILFLCPILPFILMLLIICIEGTWQLCGLVLLTLLVGGGVIWLMKKLSRLIKEDISSEEINSIISKTEELESKKSIWKEILYGIITIAICLLIILPLLNINITLGAIASILFTIFLVIYLYKKGY